jgi:hypothetical protein
MIPVSPSGINLNVGLMYNLEEGSAATGPERPINGPTITPQQVERNEAREKAVTAQATQSAEQVQTTGLPQFLTPQSLVAYCDCRLSSLEAQMQQIFNQQQSNAATTNAISQVAGDLNDLPGPNSATPPTVTVNAGQAKQIQADYLSAIKAAKAGGAGSAQLVGSLERDLRSFQNEFRSSSQSPVTKLDVALSFPKDDSVTWSVSSDKLTDLSQNLKTDGSDLNNDSQMSMINLQSLMQQQQTAVELSTNLLQTMGQTSQNIAGNMKES